jgi:hypothetical protein
MASTAPYLCIPNTILAMNAPSLNAKVLLADVIGMYNNMSKVYASDGSYATRYNISPRSVGDAMKWLDDTGYIERVTDYSVPTNRVLIPTKKALALYGEGQQNLQTPSAEFAEGAANSADPPLQNPQTPSANSADNKNSLKEQIKKGANALSEPAPVLDPVLKSWQEWAAENSPVVLKLKIQPTAAQLEKLYNDFGKSAVQDVFAQMGNHAPLLKKYTSVYLTALEWCKRRQADPKPKSTTATTPPKSQAAKIKQQLEHIPL